MLLPKSGCLRNDLGEAIRLKKTRGGHRVIKEKSRQFYYTLDLVFVEYNREEYARKCRRMGARRA